MTGVVDVGGGLRDIFGAGVFDYCLGRGIRFDYCIGVSAGSANIASYLGGQSGRNYKFYTEYAFRRRYMSLGNFIRTGSYINMDYAYGELSKKGGESPLDFGRIKSSASAMKVVAMNALTGETVYFDKSDMCQDDYSILMASSSIPVVCRPYSVRGVPYFDGGLADPVPVRRAFGSGCDKVVVILTKPRDFVRSQESDLRLVRLLRRRYPRSAEQLLVRYKKYNDGVALAKKCEEEGRALILAPEDTFGMRTLTKSRETLDRMYRMGVGAAAALDNFLGLPERSGQAAAKIRPGPVASV